MPNENQPNQWAPSEASTNWSTPEAPNQPDAQPLTDTPMPALEPSAAPSPVSQYGQPTATGYTQPAPAGYGQPAPAEAWQPSEASYGQYGQVAAAANQFQSGYRTVIPMRPLGVGETLDGVFRLLKFNPVPYFVFPLIITLITGIISALLTIAFGETSVDNPLGAVFGYTATLTGPSALVEMLLSLAASIILVVVGTRVTIATVRGYKVSLKDAFQYLKPQFGKLSLRLLGYYVLVGLIVTFAIIIVVVIAALTVGLSIGSSFDSDNAILVGAAIGIALLIFAVFVIFAILYLRIALAPSAIVAENIGPAKAIGRSWALTKGSFGYLLGTVIVVALLIGMASFLMVGIFALIGSAFSADALTSPAGTIFAALAGSTVISLVSVPVISALINLLYVNMRFKRENFHLQLIDVSGQGL